MKPQLLSAGNMGGDIARAWAAVEVAMVEAGKVDLSWIQPPPGDRGFTMAPDTLRFLAGLVREVKPQHILEFGSGLSTRLLVKVCLEYDIECGISSVDHDPDFGLAAKLALKENGPSCHVGFQIAPLVARDCGERSLPVYRLCAERLASSLPVDLVIIDGPPNVLGGREGILYQAMNIAHPGTIVLLDDASRQEEQEALRSWRANLDGAIAVNMLPGFTRGLACVVVLEQVSMEQVGFYRLRRTIRQLCDVIPSGSTFILVDENQWSDREIPDRQRIPFLERHGEYWGTPPDDETAIQELNRLHANGADSIAIGWPAFWWFEYFPEFNRYLRTRFRCLLENASLAVFELRA